MEELLKANWDSRGSESMTVRQNGERMDAAPEKKQGGQGENHDVKKDHDEKKDQELKKEQDQEQLIREA